MSEKVDRVYGPQTLQLSRFGWLTKLWLRLFVWTTYVHETPQGIVVYKKVGNVMYVLGVARKQNQVDVPEWS
jgi:hypothetical protein